MNDKRKRTRRGVHIFFVIAIAIAGFTFVLKLFSFLETNKKDELVGFAFDPLVIYAAVTMGFLCMLTWAYLSGQFREVEREKVDMIARFDAQERAEGLIPEEAQ